MKVLVTGATGFFGSGIVQDLRTAGHEVVAVGRRGGDSRVDVSDPASCAALFAGHTNVDAVVHAAALAHVSAGPAAAALCERVNVEGTRNVVEAAANAGVRRFVFISSVTVYGDYDLPVPVTEDYSSRSTSMYGAAKRRGEEILSQLAKGADVWILRLATMYAPDWLFNVRKRVAAPVIGKFVYFALDPAGRRYSLCSRRNGAEAVRWAIEGRLPSGTYNVAEQHVYSQGEILEAVAALEGAKPRVRIPVLLPRTALAVARLVPSARMRENARSRYWKFCASNVYSSARLAGHGLTLEPHLLDLTRRPHS